MQILLERIFSCQLLLLLLLLLLLARCNGF
jgi:hypothetical protein